MRQRTVRFLIALIVLTAILIWIDQANNPGLHLDLAGLQINHDFSVHEGLDLQGGLQLLLEADVPPDQVAAFDSRTMEAARVVVENRVNGLGVTEPVVQLQGQKRIIVELPGLKNPDQAIALLRETGLLEFIEAGRMQLSQGQLVRTSLDVQATAPLTGSEAITSTSPLTTPEAAATQALSGTETAPAATQALTGTETAPAAPAATGTQALTGTEVLTPTGALTSTGALTATEPVTQYAYNGYVFPTLMTGRDLKDAAVSTDNLGQVVISFELTDSGTKIFRDYTLSHVGDIVAIVLDKRVLSAPVIEEPITTGKGVISSRATGGFPLDEARSIAIEMKYGALPVPLKVVQNRVIGPTLGQDSIQRSFQAGVIGVAAVMLFMIFMYRMPGVLANLALIVYGLLNFALYKTIPVTLTMPAITGFIISTAMAVDANILVFTRMDEELRAGRPLRPAMETAFLRAWTSIRDSHIGTLLTCIVLYWFGSNYGASIVKGFALTLALGTIINLFTAIVVTRTFMRFVFDWAGDKLRRIPWLMGVSDLPAKS